MWKFLVRRIVLGLVIVILCSLIVYSVIRCLPTSYMEKIARERAAGSQGVKTYTQWLEELNRIYHMDGSILGGFFAWLSEVAQGNFGESWVYQVPVVQKYNEVIWWSVLMNVITLIVEIFISIPLGIVAARKQYSRTDYAVTVFALACISLPTFFLATILKYVFAVRLGWFPLYGLSGRWYQTGTVWYKIGDILYHLVLPVLTLATLSIGGTLCASHTQMSSRAASNSYTVVSLGG